MSDAPYVTALTFWPFDGGYSYHVTVFNPATGEYYGGVGTAPSLEGAWDVTVEYRAEIERGPDV